jgi:hypothetical protein
MGRRRTPLGTFGEFTYITSPNGKIKARVRFRDDDGQLRLVQATGDTRKSAERALKQKLTRRDRLTRSYKVIHASSVGGSRADNQNPTDHQSSNASQVTPARGGRTHASSARVAADRVHLSTAPRSGGRVEAGLSGG